jgi:hypothetical protein
LRNQPASDRQEGCLFTFQNCFNEIPENTHAEVVKSIIAQLATTRSGAILLMVELYQYPQSHPLVKARSAAAETRGFGWIMLSPKIRSTFNCQHLYENMPPILTPRLFVTPRDATQADSDH